MPYHPPSPGRQRQVTLQIYQRYIPMYWLYLSFFFNLLVSLYIIVILLLIVGVMSHDFYRLNRVDVDLHMLSDLVFICCHATILRTKMRCVTTQ